MDRKTKTVIRYTLVLRIAATSGYVYDVYRDGVYVGIAQTYQN